MRSFESKNLYEILDVTSVASESQIKRRYRLIRQQNLRLSR